MYIFYDKLKETENDSRKVFRSPLMSLLGLHKMENFGFCEVFYVTAMLILEELIQQRTKKILKKRKKESFKEGGMALCMKSAHASSKAEIKEDRKPLVLV